MGPHHHHHPWVDHGGGGLELLLPLLPALLMVLLLLMPLLRLGTTASRADDAGSWIPPGLRGRWHAAVARHAEVARSFAAYECDPGAVLRLPALADVRQPATARFIDAFTAAAALQTDRYPGKATAEAFTAASERAVRAWAAALDAAERWRRAQFQPGEQTLLDQAATLLTLARNTPHAGERASAYRRTAQHLAELDRRCGWSLPPRTADVLQQETRAALTVS